MAHIRHKRASTWWSNTPWILHRAEDPVQVRVSLQGNEMNCCPAKCRKNSHQSRREFRQEKATFMKIHADFNHYLM